MEGQYFTSNSDTILFKLTWKMSLKEICYSRPDVTCNEINISIYTSFTVFPQFFTDKIVANITGILLVAYPFHVLFLNVSHSYRKWLVNNGLTKIRIPSCLLYGYWGLRTHSWRFVEYWKIKIWFHFSTASDLNRHEVVGRTICD